MTWFGVANSGELLFSTPNSGLYDFSELTGDVQGTIDTTEVRGIAGYALPTGTPLTDQIIKFNGTSWEYSPDASGSGLVAHSLLGIYHSDTEDTGAPTRGDIIVGNASGLWSALSLGTAGFVLYSDGTDALYTRLGQNTPFELGTEAAPSMTFVGDLDTGWSAASGDVMIGSAGGVGLLTLDGIDGQVEFNAGQVHKTRSGGSTTLLDDDYIYMVTSTPSTVTLPATAEEGQTYIIKDRDGNATGSNFITIAGNGNTIDGNANILIRNRYGSFTLVWSGSEWHVI